MNANEERLGLRDNSGRFAGRAIGFLGKALVFSATVVLVVAGLLFSLVVFALAAVGTLLTLGYLWWKTRDLRRQAPSQSTAGRIIEGEAIRENNSP